MTRAAQIQAAFEAVWSRRFKLHEDMDFDAFVEAVHAELPMTEAEFDAGFNRFRDVKTSDLREQAAENFAKADHLRRIQALAEGLPPGTSLQDAARIRADQGDAFAQELLA